MELVLSILAAGLCLVIGLGLLVVSVAGLMRIGRSYRRGRFIA